MRRKSKRVSALLAAVLLLMLPLASSAEEGAIYEWPSEEAPVLIENQSGLFLLGSDGSPLRVFSWNRNQGAEDRAVRLIDMDGDGNPNIVGSGTPTFVLQANGNPIFGEADGCRQVQVGRLVSRRGLDLVCVKRREVRAYTADGQFAWGFSPGVNIDYCRIGEVSGTGEDVECKLAGREQYVRISGNGELLNDAGTSHMVAAGDSRSYVRPVQEGVWTGEETFDLTGDGRPVERIVAVEAGLEIRRGEEEEPLFTVETGAKPLAAMVTTFGEEESSSIVALTANHIFVIRAAGEEVSRYSANAGRYRRVPHGELVSVFARGFGEGDSDAREAVRGVQAQISQCYGNRLRAHPFAGSGRQMVQVLVDESGAVKEVNQTASQVGDRQVEDCARQALRRGNYPAATEGQGTINVNIVFTFRDEER